MRILKIRLADYRGIESLTVPLRRDGITIVAGPNEAGKSSLAEAVSLLFDYHDSADRKETRAVTPVHRDDAGPEIEIEAESGPYAFTYRKRFARHRLTELTITRPRAENLKGREAHDRALAILRETMDADLWRALLVAQGKAFEQADLPAQSALTRALDRAAGGTSADPRGESLFALVEAEAGLYYTDKGTERVEVQRARQAVEDAERAAAECRRRLLALDAAVEDAARTDEEIRALAPRIADLEERVRAREAELAEIAALEAEVERRRLSYDLLARSREAADRERMARADLAAAVARRREETEAAARAADSLGPDLRQARQAAAERVAATEAAEAAHAAAAALARLRREDAEHLRSRLDLDQLSERKERVDRARERAAVARDVLARNPVDEAVLRGVEDADRAVTRAEAGLAAGAPTIRLRAIAAVEVEAGGRARTVPAGGEEEIPVPDRAKVVAPGAVEVEVVAGSSLSGLWRQAEAARDGFAAACAKAGARSLAEARAAHAERQAAERDLAALKDVEKADLRDLTYERLEAKVAGLAKHLPEYPARRPAGAPPLPPDFDAARRLETEARTAAEEAERRAAASRRALEEARGLSVTVEHEEVERRTRLRAAEQALAAAEQDLGAARARASDEALAAALATAEEEATTAARALTAAREVLGRKDPGRVREMAAAEGESRDAALRRQEQCRSHRADLQRLLDAEGAQGLSEALAAAEADGERARSARDGLLRRAAAALLLLDTLRTHRDAVRRTYLGPLRERIEALGRFLFDGSFGVDVGEDLGIASRTLRGVTVPFAELSTGTKEQLSLIARIACAMLVAEEGGPLLLDDVLGHTDPGRLAAMGAVLRHGGRQCQIVLFTSMPDRYAHVGEADVVRLTPPA